MCKFVQYSILQIYLFKYIIIIRKGVINVAKQKKKRRRQKPTARPNRMVDLAVDILAGTVSGLVVLAIQKLLDW